MRKTLRIKNLQCISELEYNHKGQMMTMATTNSTIKSFNKIIKDKVTDFEKLSINNFILTLLDRVGWTREKS